MDPLVAAAIHDAKNGLNALGTWLAAAEREHPSAALAEARSIAARVGDELVELLALYRAGEGSLRLAVDDHDLTDFVADLVADLRLPPGAGALQVEAGAAGELGAWAFDAYPVRLLLQDALRNAARHARSRITLSLGVAGRGICFTVADDGPGFSDAILAGGEAAMQGAGSGLGLRFASLIAQRHATPDGRRGRIELSNDGGAVFRLFLP